MSEDAPMTVDAWLDLAHQTIGDAAGPALSPGERMALLDVARVAAHASQRTAAPLTTFLAGVAYGAMGVEEREAALRSLAERLEA